ncbi:MAG: hypothetical protein M0Q38_17085 [Bacteroidales bacterium]|jgi:hypothetical protein|nr:hypothetical protein [Bacteroidales bacterium]
MNTITNYLNDIFGEQVNIVALTDAQMNKIPYYIGSLYTLWYGQLLNRHVYFAMHKDGELLTPDQYKKHMDILQGLLEAPVILVLKGTESYNRNRLIQKNINFILENKQIFLPSLLVDLKDYLKPAATRKEHLTPAAQFLLLFHLQKQSLDGANYKHVTEAVHYTYLTVSRAIETLTSFGLCKTEGGKEKFLRFEENRKELWQKALPFLMNPIKKSVFINDELPEQFRILTGINALAHYTNIGGAPMDQFAISVQDFQTLHKAGMIQMFSEYDGRYNVELWKYHPIIFDEQEFVDRLSLYLIFRTNRNERIEIELETMLENMPW